MPTAGAKHPWKMPEKPAASAPACHTRVNILAAWEGGVRPELKRAEFAEYLVGEGKGTDGSLPEMFTSDDDPPSSFRSAWLMRDKSVDDREPGFDGTRWPLMQAWCADIIRRELWREPRSFRVVLAPEPAVSGRMGKEAMQSFARTVMTAAEIDLCRGLYWAGSAHFNTDNHHVHVGIRGIDKVGRPIVMPAKYIERGFEYRARAALAEMFPKQKAARRAG